MLTFSELQNALDLLRGTGRWAWIAEEAGCNYGTISRIVRNKVEPGVKLAEKLSIATQKAAAMERKAKAEVSA